MHARHSPVSLRVKRKNYRRVPVGALGGGAPTGALTLKNDDDDSRQKKKPQAHRPTHALHQLEDPRPRHSTILIFYFLHHHVVLPPHSPLIFHAHSMPTTPVSGSCGTSRLV